MVKEMTDRAQYYKEYYRRQKDIRKYQYYEKKDRLQEMEQIYAPYGGEKAYYAMKIKEFCSAK
tara:strand:+ start:529 stop:717 length:189 start_codon:yes stop_codon:yes gene_type:complete